MTCPDVCRYVPHPAAPTDAEKYEWAMAYGPENVWCDGEVTDLTVAVRVAVRMFDDAHTRREADR